MSNVLDQRGWEHLTDWVFVIPPLGAIFTPLFLGALADQRFNAERVLAAVVLANALSTAGAFGFLALGDSVVAQTGFLSLLVCKALLGAPSWSLLMAVTLTHLQNPERHFGGIRVWGTLGWMVAGGLVSLLALDESPGTGMLAGVAGVCAALASLSLPATPPSGIKPQSLTAALGLKAFSIFRDRDTAVYFLTAFCFAIPLAAYYPYTSKFAKDLGIEHVAAFLVLGQGTEIIAMLLMGWAFRRLRLRWLFLLALTAGSVRYVCYFFGAKLNGADMGLEAIWLVAAGVLMHGICWTFFFESGRIFVDRRVARNLRSQAQSLLTVFTGGLATVIGVFFSGFLYRWCVEGPGPGWPGFWLILTSLCMVGLIVFALGYQGLPLQEPKHEQEEQGS
jgi:MFS family permease